MAKSEIMIRGRPVVNGQAGFVEVPFRPVASDCGSPVLSAFAGFPVSGHLADGG